MQVNPKLTEKAKRDYQLIRKAVDDNDQRAYAELMSYYRDSLYFMLLKMTNNPVDAEDLTIESFGKAFKKLAQYTPDYAFSTWLFKIASNNCIDFIRKKKKNLLSIDKPVDGEDDSWNLANQLASSNLDPEEEMVRSQKIERTRQVVDKLKPHYKKLIEMRYFQELSYEEISEQLDLPLGTVKAQLFRAREFLQNFIKNSAEGI